jgi:serine/threonine protein kinase
MRIIGWSLPNSQCKKARIATEYASNGSIEDILVCTCKGDIPLFWTHENISCIIIGFVIGMKYLHSKDIIHGDLKPGNLLLDSNFRVQICDFGRNVFEDCGATTESDTAVYISPESLEDNPPTKKVDVFAFGLILYEILIGESVFPKDANLARIYKLHRTETRPEIPKWISRPISELIESCWSSNPSSRPTFDEIYDQLEANRFNFFDDVRSEVVLEFISSIVSWECQT